MAQILLSLREIWMACGGNFPRWDHPSRVSDSKREWDFRGLGIQGVPAIFVVQPDTEVAKPIAYGLQSLEQIELNLVRQLDEERTL